MSAPPAASADAPHGDRPGVNLPHGDGSAGAVRESPGAPTHALLARLAAVRERVTALVEQRAAGDPTADDPLRGLYLSDEAVRHLLRTWRPPPATTPPAPPPAGTGPGRHPTGWRRWPAGRA